MCWNPIEESLPEIHVANTGAIPTNEKEGDFLTKGRYKETEVEVKTDMGEVFKAIYTHDDGAFIDRQTREKIMNVVEWKYLVRN